MFFRGLQREKRSKHVRQLVKFVGEFVGVEPLVKPSQESIHLQTALEATDGIQRRLVFHPGLLFGVKEEAVIAQQAQDQASA
jgi:hypothetical protein